MKTVRKLDGSGPWLLTLCLLQPLLVLSRSPEIQNLQGGEKLLGVDNGQAASCFVVFLTQQKTTKTQIFLKYMIGISLTPLDFKAIVECQNVFLNILLT